jgi:hypothetical protein
MPSRVINMLVCWKGNVSKKGLSVIWNAVPLCLMWMFWWERNRRTFDDSKGSVDLKFIFLRAICDSMDALSSHLFSTTLDLVDFCYPCRYYCFLYLSLFLLLLRTQYISYIMDGSFSFSFSMKISIYQKNMRSHP